jgi:hypothetical protein
VIGLLLVIICDRPVKNLYMNSKSQIVDCTALSLMTFRLYGVVTNDIWLYGIDIDDV